jgi:serine/threonine-protein kinase
MKAGETLGNFEIRAPLGKGGMGEVYKAYDTSLDRFVAIKVLPPKLAADQALRARFHTETLALARVRHPNLVHIYTVGTERGINYFAMEYVKGRSLLLLIKTKGRLDHRQCLFIAGEALGALHKLHENGLVHRDVKPANIMIDRDGRVILMDLGLAKTEEVGVTTDGAIVGTPQYISPEQAQGESVDVRSDLYSLAVVMYEMLTGAPPFHGKSAFAVVRQHVETPPPPLTLRAPDVPEDVASIVMKALEKDRSRRYQDAAEMAADMYAVSRAKSLRTILRDAERKGRAVPAPPPRPPADTTPPPRLPADTAPPPPHAATAPPPRRRLKWAVVGGLYLLALVVSVTIVIALLRSSDRRRRPPQGPSFPAHIVTAGGPAVDGRIVSYDPDKGVFTIRLPDGALTQLHIREIRSIRRARDD